MGGAKCHAPATPLRVSSAMKALKLTPPRRPQVPGPTAALNVAESHASIISTRRADAPALGRAPAGAAPAAENVAEGSVGRLGSPQPTSKSGNRVRDAKVA